MTITETLAKADIPIRKSFTRFFPRQSVFFYSYVRKFFLKLLVSETVPERRVIPAQFSTKLWGLDFYAPLFNAAGMFKNGLGYHTAVRQGAGAFLAGTTTEGGRKGNLKNNILHPFISFPRTGIAINWMGLPNPGHSAVAKTLSNYEKAQGFPIGASLAADPLANDNHKIEGLVFGLNQYDKAGVDFLEINESCPNVPSHQNSSGMDLDQGLLDRLASISKDFLAHRRRNLPVIVKFSVDTQTSLIPQIIDLLIDLGFDGINLGNTSIDYSKIRPEVAHQEKKLFDHFTTTFGGGVSGTAIKDRSLILCKAAADHLATTNIKSEFHIIRTGGIENAEDMKQNTLHGISLSQWFTGYFDRFIIDGHDLYKKIFVIR
jgi:dihydroorotate dehydrogenase (NAD+) catalytic subunit